jgi:hypothetical protein
MGAQTRCGSRSQAYAVTEQRDSDADVCGRLSNSGRGVTAGQVSAQTDHDRAR